MGVWKVTKSMEPGEPVSMSTSSAESYEKLLATTELSEAERYDLLSSERRRAICRVLDDGGAPISFEELATEVTAREDCASSEKSDVKIALHHIHLPKLAAAGIIDYDYETRQIQRSSASLGPLAE
jgi:hypothetical protein